MHENADHPFAEEFQVKMDKQTNCMNSHLFSVFIWRILYRRGVGVGGADIVWVGKLSWTHYNTQRMRSRARGGESPPFVCVCVCNLYLIDKAIAI